MTVLVVGVGGLVGDSDGEIGEQRGDQIESGVCGFGEDSEAACGDADNDFSRGDEERGNDRVSSDCAFFGAHGVGRIEGRRPGHDGIIAGNRGVALVVQCVSGARFGSLRPHSKIVKELHYDTEPLSARVGGDTPFDAQGCSLSS